MFPPKDQPALRRLMLSDGLRTVDDQLVMFVAPTLALLALQMSASQASLIAMAEWLPALLLSGIAGRAADRFDRRRVLMAGGFLAIVGLAVMCLVPLATEVARFPLLFAAVFLYGSAGVLSSLTANAFVPALATRITVSEALSIQSGVRSTARISGQALAGPITQFLGSIPAIVLAACLSFAGTVAASFIQAPQASERSTDAHVAGFSPWRTVAANPLLRAITSLAFTMNLGGAIIYGAFFAYVYRTLDLSPVAVGSMLFVGGGAAVVSAQLARRLTKRWPAKSLCTIAGVTAAMAAWMIPAAALGPPLLILVAYQIVFSSAATIFMIAFAVVRQAIVGNSNLGQVIAVSSTLAAAALVVGTSISAVLVAHLGVLKTIVVGCATSSTGVLALVSLSQIKSRGARGGTKAEASESRDSVSPS